MSGTPTISARPTSAARVLHTSDWHLGCSVRNHPRCDDHDAVIAEILGIAAAAGPDLIVHTGDLFDGPRPPMSEFGRAIRALRALGEVAPVVVLAGNHDSVTALEVLGVAVQDDHPDLLAAGGFHPHHHCGTRIRVHARPTVPEKGAVTTYQTDAGWDLRLAALPFVHANRVLVDFDQLCQPNATYNDSLRRIIATLSTVCFDDFDPTRQVAMFASHLHLNGARASSERHIHVSADYAADPAHLSPGYGYLAFGHIHVPQDVAGGRGRYAGSILEIDFGETGEDKRVVVVDLEPGRPTRITSVPLHAGRRLHRLAAPLPELAAHADTVGTGLVEVTITVDPASGPVNHDTPIVVDGATFDTLSAAVRAVLPDAAVVAVVDARNPHILPADELEIASPGDTVEEAFTTWLTEQGAPVFDNHGEGIAQPVRVAELFAELYATVVAGDIPGPKEMATIRDLAVAAQLSVEF